MCVGGCILGFHLDFIHGKDDPPKMEEGDPERAKIGTAVTQQECQGPGSLYWPLPGPRESSDPSPLSHSPSKL